VGSVRRLLLLVCALVLVDTMLYAALVPLLGHFAERLHLSSAQAGVLVAAYAAGALLGGLPGGIAAARLGPRRAVLCGLGLMGAASVGFAWSDAFWALAAARLMQGAGSSFTWAGAFTWLLSEAPRERRGEVIGTAMGAAVLGALLGPVAGAAASLLGRGWVFTALAALDGVLALLTLRIASHPPERFSAARLRRAAREPAFASGVGLLGLGALLFGVLDVLAPLRLAGSGWAPVAIGAVFLIAAAIEAGQAPYVGRLSDRRGPLMPVRYALAVGVPASLALMLGVPVLLYALLVVVASLAYGVVFTPAFALIADGADRAGLAQGLAFGMMNAAWAVGAMAGPAAAGALAGLAGEDLPLALAAGACAGALALCAREARAPRASAPLPALDARAPRG
jgi:MFS family permease